MRFIVAFLSIFLTANALSAADKNISVVREMGDKNAPVIIEEFSSITCNFCAKLHNEYYLKLKKEYIDTKKVRLIYRNYPLDDIAFAAGLIALKVPEERFFNLLSYMFFEQKKLFDAPSKTLFEWAEKSGFSEAETEAIIKDKEYSDALTADMKVIEVKYGISATPTIIINGTKFEGLPTKTEFFGAIDKAYADATK